MSTLDGIINLTNAYIRKLVEIVQNTDVSHAQKMDAIGEEVQYEWDALNRRTATVIFDKKNIIRYKPLNLPDFFWTKQFTVWRSKIPQNTA